MKISMDVVHHTSKNLANAVSTQRQLASFTAKPMMLNTWLSLLCGDIVEADALPTRKSPSALPQLSPPSPLSLNTTKNLNSVFYSGNSCTIGMKKVSIITTDQIKEKENVSRRMTEYRRSINFSQSSCWIFIVLGLITCVQTRQVVNVDTGHDFRKRSHLCIRVRPNLLTMVGDPVWAQLRDQQHRTLVPTGQHSSSSLQGPSLKTRPAERLSWLHILVTFPIPLMSCDLFLPNPLQLIIH